MILFQSDKINFHLKWVHRGVSMTDPVKGVSGAQGTSSGGSYSGGAFSEHHKKKGAPAPQDDLIEISKDARDRSKGKTKKGILEYLKELLG
jgi:hypothetical protein